MPNRRHDPTLNLEDPASETSVGRRIEAGFTRKSLNVSSFARALRVPNSTVNAWLKGTLPGTDMLAAMAPIIDLSVDEIMHGRRLGRDGPKPGNSTLRSFTPDADVPTDRLLDIAMEEGISELKDARDACVALREGAAGLRGIDEDFARKHFRIWKREQALAAGEKLVAAHELAAKEAVEKANAEVDAALAAKGIRRIGSKSDAPKGKR